MAKYTDDQINEAIMLANQTGKVYVWETEMYSNVIKHLPEPAQDDWQQCAWDDILHTDERVKAEYTSGTIIEGVPDGINDTRIWLVDGNTMPFESDAKWYRIPAPVQHPDPEQHPVIIVRDATILNPKQAPLPMMWAEDSYMGGGYHLQPESITSWSPAKVVADND